MSEDNSSDPRLADVERRLAALVPRDARLNRAQTLFLAGQESALRHQTQWRIAWPLVTAASVLVSVITTAAFVRRPEERIVEVDRPIVQPEPRIDETATEPDAPDRRESIRASRDWVTEPRSEPQAELGYLYARRLALEFGVDSLPKGVTVASNGNLPPLRYGDWRRGLGDDDLPFAEPGRRGIEESTESRPGLSGGSS